MPGLTEKNRYDIIQKKTEERDNLMKERMTMTEESWIYGSYLRSGFRWDIIYTILQYREMNGIFNLNLGKLNLRDEFVEGMEQDGLISREEKNRFYTDAKQVLLPLDQFDEAYIEDIYGTLHQRRIQSFGIDKIEEQQRMLARRERVFDPTEGIDQRSKKEERIHFCQTAVFLLTDSALFFLMRKDLEKVLKNEKEVYLITAKERGNLVPSRPWMEGILEEMLGDAWKKIHFLSMECRNGSAALDGIEYDQKLEERIREGKTVLFAYGEDCFLQCRDLRMDCLVCGSPSGYFTKAVTNQHGKQADCVVYLPAGFSIIRWVKIWEKTRVSYWHLAKLWENYGDEIYQMTPAEWYRFYPQYFFNVYSQEKYPVETKEDYPVRISWEDKHTNLGKIGKILEQREKKDLPEQRMIQFDQRKEQAIKAYLEKQAQMEYRSVYYDEELYPGEIPWDCQEQQPGILVQAVRMGRLKNSFLLQGEGKTVREVAKEQFAEDGTLRILSNFLFFLTPRLMQVYNEVRRDRSEEQISRAGSHLDYMLCWEEGKRRESFPLFRKTCFGKKRDGSCQIFPFVLGGGSLWLSEEKIRWEKEQVDADGEKENFQISDEVRIYTPLYGDKLEKKGKKEPKEMVVGEGRINFIIFQDEIICIRRGGVLLSSVGVVLSFKEEKAAPLLKKIGAKETERGYYRWEPVDLLVKLDPPVSVKKEDWEQMEWVYGGGLSLILDGVGICDVGEDQMAACLVQEGWNSILSRQTQESAIHKLVKHPRTGIGVTKQGELLLLVYSGRTKFSSGADYREMIAIARDLFPDIWNFINVDGGGSSVLGFLYGNSFVELSYPATSMDNCAGMARPVNTVFVTEPERRKS